MTRFDASAGSEVVGPTRPRPAGHPTGPSSAPVHRASDDPPAQLLVEPAHEGGERDAHRDAEGAGLDQVQPPLAALSLADEPLRLSQPSGQLLLGQARVPPGLAEASEEDLVLPREDRLVHAAVTPAAP